MQGRKSIFSTLSYFLLPLLLFSLAIERTEAVCGNNIVESGEQCDNTTAGGCCLTTCLNATSSNVINTSPSTLTVAVAASTLTYLTATQLQLVTSGTNYPLSYSVVSALPSFTTFVPTTAPVFTYDNALNRLNFVNGWAGTYIVTIASTYCTATGGSLIFTRSLTNANYGTCSTSGIRASQVFCSPTSGPLDRSRCDCSLQTCRTSFRFNALTCYNGYLSCGQACSDVRSPKPVSFTLLASQDIDCSVVVNTCNAVNNIGCTCPAVCGDNIKDTTEVCDTNVPGACCTTNCQNTTTPTTNIVASASMTLTSSATQTLSTLQLTGTSNFPVLMQVVSITGIAGLSATADTSNVYFNSVFTGTATIRFTAVFCAATNVAFNFTRIVTMNSCGNGVMDPGEQCDSSAYGGCCLTNCTTATPANMINTSPSTLTVAVPASANTYLTSTTLQLMTTGANYPLRYVVVSAAPDFFSYAPAITPPSFTYDNTLNRLNFVNGWAGTYVVVLAVTYCNATNSSLFFTRTLTNTAYSTCTATQANSQAYCASETVTTIDQANRCDCFLQPCVQSFRLSLLNPTCYSGYTTCARACADLRSTKPRSFTIAASIYNTASCTSPTCGGTTASPLACTCAPVCGDGILDAGEICDDPVTVGSCCFSNCQNTSSSTLPTTTILPVVSVSVGSSVAQDYPSLALSGTSNFVAGFQVTSVTGLPGVTATNNATHIIFNTLFTGNVTLVLTTTICAATNTFYTVTRYVYMNSCGNGIINPGETCEFAMCCGEYTCQSRTADDIGNNDPQFSIFQPTISQTITYSDLQLTSFNQYGVNYNIVSYGPTDCHTFPPNSAFGNVSMNINASGLTFSRPWIGNYTVYLNVVFCGFTYNYTRQIYLPAFSTFSQEPYIGVTNLICTVAPADKYTSFCDCGYSWCFSAVYINRFSQCYLCYVLSNVCVTVCNRTGQTVNSYQPAAANTGPSDCTIYQTGNRSTTCNPICGNSKLEIGEYCEAGSIDGMLGSCCTTDCQAPIMPYLYTKNVTLSSCTTNVLMTSTGLNLTGIANNFALSYTVVNVSGVAGVGASMTATTFTFNTTFTGTVLVYISSVYCNTTGEAYIFTRYITSPSCCGNGVVNPGEDCDLGTGVNGVSTNCCSSLCSYVAASANQVCRVSAGPCDLAETCPGGTSTCPANALAPSTTMCRNITGPCDKAEFCTGSATTCPSDTFQTAGTVCRATSDLCDTAAVCSGSAVTCPANGFASSSVVCRPSAGICDPQETCTGSSYSCPANVFSSSSVQCRASTGICDPAEFCTFNNASCPSDAFLPSTSLCRAAVSVCDAAEFCTGSSGSCPTDLYQPSGTVCRANVSICDVAEVCNGITTACPADAFAPSSVVCRASAGVCDVQEQCTGTSSTCPANVFAGPSVQCRASVDLCDAPEFCTFNNASCPPDSYYGPSTTCRPASGGCDSAEVCSGSSPACPPDTYQASGFVCRPVADVCDVAETCSGLSPVCPADAFKQNTVICRNQSGACDIPEYCSGTSASCSADFYATNGTVCRPIVDLCDIAETCDGINPTCPADAYASNGTVCRASAGVCDQVETCSGLSTACPSNVFLDSSVICNPSQGGCDPDEYCSGSSALCPTDILTANGVVCNASTGSCESNARCDGATPTCPSKVLYNSSVVCRPSAGVCDTAETCTGVDAACPVNVFRPSSFICSASTGVCMPNSFCDGSTALCTILPFYNSTVLCRPSIGACDIDDYCTGSTAACSPNAVQPSGYVCDVQTSDNTCKVNTTCSDLNGLCTPTYLSVGSPCRFDSNYCYSDTCAAAVNSTTVCVRGPAINYDDGLFCNGVETCNPATGLKISGTPVVCNDASSCTTDSCSNAQAACVFTPVANSVGPCGGGLGACTPGNYSCNGAGPSPVITCVGAVTPVPEICFNGIDDNCNGQIDEFCTGLPCNTTQDCMDNLNLTQCNSAVCTLGQCQVFNYNTSTLCNDGLKCTRDDHCDGTGSCVGTQIFCDDQNTCTQDSCSEEYGQCVFNASVLNGSPCVFEIYMDSSRAFYDPCVAESQCSNGQCVITATLDCPVTSECDMQYCNLEAGRCADKYLQGKPCQNGDVCELNGVCVDGQGCVTAPRICDDFIPCTVDTCVQRSGDPCNHAIAAGYCLIGGQCYSSGDVNPYNPCLSCQSNSSTSEWTAVLVSSPCDDGDLCTVNDVCSFGTCSGTPLDCSAHNGQCTESTCQRGQCVSIPSNIGVSCSDGLDCTVNDACTISGECTGTDLNCAQFSTQCTLYTCSEDASGCVAQQVDDYTRCQLNTDLCDGQEYCLGGVCVHGSPLSCTTNNTCLLASCDPQQGCITTPRTNSACNDSNVCTVGDACGSDGLCYPGAVILDCDDGNPCTYDECDSVQGCVHTQLSSCTVCTVDSDCDSTACQVATCIAGMCTYNALLAGTSCGLDQACSRNDYCTDSGVCVTLIPESCDDHNVCTADSCTMGLGCVFTPLVGTPCDDNDLCTVNDQCSGGVCSGVPFACPASTDCLDYTCQVVSGAPTCIAVPRNIGGSCTSSDLCQVNGHCTSTGLCSTVNVSCPAPTECTPEYTCAGGVCSPVHSNVGSPCNIGDLCTSWSCNGAGVCLANLSSSIVCPFNATATPCQRQPVCIPHTGECYPQFVDDGTACDDGNLCTSFDSCHGGVCIGEEYYTCDNSLYELTCHGPPLCDPVTGCYRVPLPDGEPCYYNDGCVTLSTCVAGSCTIPLLEMYCEVSDPCTLSMCSNSQCIEDVNTLDGVGCYMGNECFPTGTCTLGQCVSGPVIACPDALDCGVSYCSPDIGCLTLGNEDCHSCGTVADCPYFACKSAVCSSGVCSYIANDTALSGCNDGLYCNGEELCSEGICVLGVFKDCDDSNECTLDACNDNLQMCTHTPVAVNSSCVSATDLCAISSRCNALGECVPSVRAECTFTEPCRVSLGCNATTGGCSSDVLPDGTACIPNDPCAGVGVCDTGVCVYSATKNCSAFEGGFCTESYVCNRQSGGSCDGVGYVPTACSDDSACTLGDVCSGNGTCIAGIYSPCEFVPHDNQCQYVLCELDGSCTIHDYSDATPCLLEGAPLGPCSGSGDSCQSGVCVRPYAPGLLCRSADSSGCDVDDYCTMGNDYCPEDVKALGGTVCTPTVYCSAPTGECSGNGECLVTQQRDCTLYDSPCTIGVCDEASSSCVAALRPENEACEAPDLPCVEHSGCYFGYCLAYAAPSHVNCSDDNGCTTNDHCSGVDDTCLPGETLNCSATLQDAECVSATCNATTGQCEFEPINEGGACNADDNLCTTGDSCQLGVCVAGPGMDCSYLDSDCQRGVCTSSTTCGVEILGKACSPDYCEGNCTAPIEWWTVHTSQKPEGGLFTWPDNYEQQTLCGTSYYDWAQQAYGDNAWISLFHQWLGASLNQKNGACMPNTTNTALEEAFTLLSSCDTTNVYFTNSSAAPYRELLYIIYAYNSGVNGPGLCDPSYCFHDDTATAECLFIAVPYFQVS